MKMIKKLISVSLILTTAMVMGALVDVEKINAAYDDVTYDADTIVDITGTTAGDLKIKSWSKAEKVAVNASNVTIDLATDGLGNDSDITFESANGEIMSVDCTAGATFTAGTPLTSTMQIVYNASCPTVVLTIGSGTLTEANVAASDLTAGAASVYTVSFRTVNSLSSTDEIRLDFGTGFTIADTGGTVVVTDTTTGTATAVTSTFDATASTNKVIITLSQAVAAKRVLNIVLTTIVTNPAATSDVVSLSGIDISTTTANAAKTIDSLADQTAFNRVIKLEPGWNVFATSQDLEDSTYTTVLAPIGASNYSDIKTLAWDSTTSTMTWQTTATIKPLYGYAIYITASSAVKLPLDFAKETGTNGTFARNLDNRGWYLIGYVGTSASKDAETAGNCLDGLLDTNPAGTYAFSSLVDLTGTTVNGSVPSSHSIVSATTDQVPGVGTSMKFARDYGYAVFTTVDNLVLKGDRSL